MIQLKFLVTGLRYEFGLPFLTNQICAVYGSFPSKIYPDQRVVGFRLSILLSEHGSVIADGK